MPSILCYSIDGNRIILDLTNEKCFKGNWLVPCVKVAEFRYGFSTASLLVTIIALFLTMTCEKYSLQLWERSKEIGLKKA